MRRTPTFMAGSTAGANSWQAEAPAPLARRSLDDAVGQTPGLSVRSGLPSANPRIPAIFPALLPAAAWLALAGAVAAHNLVIY